MGAHLTRMLEGKRKAYIQERELRPGGYWVAVRDCRLLLVFTGDCGGLLTIRCVSPAPPNTYKRNSYGIWVCSRMGGTDRRQRCRPRPGAEAGNLPPEGGCPLCFPYGTRPRRPAGGGARGWVLGVTSPALPPRAQSFSRARSHPGPSSPGRTCSVSVTTALLQPPPCLLPAERPGARSDRQVEQSSPITCPRSAASTFFLVGHERNSRLRSSHAYTSRGHAMSPNAC